MPARGFWSLAFRLGLYDALMPINYDRSLQDAWNALAPPPAGHVLDAGCGGGRLLVHSRAWLAVGGRLTAADVDEYGLAATRRRARKLGVADRVEVCVADLRRLTEAKLPPLDGVLAHFSVYTLASDADRRQAVRQLSAVLRPGRRCVVVVPSEHYGARQIITDARAMERVRTDRSALSRMIRLHVVYPVTRLGLGRIERAMERGSFHRYTAEELTGHLREAGLQAIQISRTYGGCGYRAVATKP